MDSVDTNKLDTLKIKIEGLNKFHQIEILKILSNKLCKLNENKNGIFVNMSFLPSDVIEELDKYICYVEEQDETLKTIEFQKEEFKNIISEQESNNTIISYHSVK